MTARRHYFKITVNAGDLKRSNLAAHPLPESMVMHTSARPDLYAVTFEGWHEGTPADIAEVARLMEVARPTTRPESTEETR